MSEDDFKNAPQSIGELRAERNDDAGAWSPRDMLVTLLREIDSGETTMKSCVVIYRDNDDKSTRYIRASDSFTKDIGMIEQAKFQLLCDMGDAPNE